MKKILSLLILFCFIATTTSYAQFFRGQSDNDNSSSGSGSAVYDSNAGKTVTETNDDYGGGFFRSSDADTPGGRPGNGDAIGQEAPLKDGLPVMIGCCLLLIVVKSVNERLKKKMININVILNN